jgi:hypothetical protein
MVEEGAAGAYNEAVVLLLVLAYKTLYPAT